MSEKRAQTKRKTTPTSKSTSKPKTKPKTKSTANKKPPNVSIRKKNHEYEFQLLGLLAFTVLSIVSLHTKSAGAVGNILKELYFGLFATAGFGMPYFIFGIIFLGINRTLAHYRKTWMPAFFLAMLVLSISVTLAEQQYLPQSCFTMDGVRSANQLGIEGKGGGIVGTFVVTFLFNVVGLYGTYVLLMCMVMTILLITTPFSLHAISEIFKDTAVKTGEVISESKRNSKELALLAEEDEEEPEEQIAKKHFSIMKLMRMDLFAKHDEEDTENEKLEEPDTHLEEATFEPVSKVKSSSKATPETTGEDFDDIPIIESAPVVAAKPKPEPQAPIRTQSSKPTGSSKKEPMPDIPKEIQPTTECSWSHYLLPSTELLSTPLEDNSQQNRKEILANAKLLEETLGHFGIEVKVIQISRGPAITRYELQPSPGIKVSRIVSLSDDIALNLAAQQVRIVAPIPGKAAVGIEIPNKSISTVTLREVLESENFSNVESKLAFSLGKDIGGKPIIADLAKMPHLLVAGATGSGKSVCINTIITSILFRARPDEVKFLMVDPKVVELNVYNGIPHLILPVVTDPKKASVALNWAVQEMTERYKSFAEMGVRDIAGYNRKIEAKGEGGAIMPKIVVIIDELADLMMVAPNAVEDAICRLAQMARAAGIHLIIATQRPSVDVITGVIKANVPSRIAFAVSSMTDSRTIIDMGGAEKLLGKGDMLYYPVGESKPMRVQGSFISDTEVEDLIQFIKEQSGEITYNPEILDTVKAPDLPEQNVDEMLEQAIEFVISTQQASASMLQRKFRLGYNRAARLIDSMEERGIVGPSMGSKPREVLMTGTEYSMMYETEEDA